MSISRRGLFRAIFQPIGEATQNVATPEAPEPIRRVRIDRSRCFVFRGPECGACNVCPTQPRALRFRADRPSIDPVLCTACGDCVSACVMTPAAIEWYEIEVEEPVTS